MAAKITELIDKTDTSETVRDQIAAILAVESAKQQTLATADGQDPNDWKIRVFTERRNPWDEWNDLPEQDAADAVPIVNVALESLSYDASSSNIVKRQRAIGTYHIDCFGYGVSEDDPAGGHHAGDMRASIEAQRALRLVRNILMSAHYAYLDMQGTVGHRWPESVQSLQVPIDARTLQHVHAFRLAFRVEFNETSPQHQGEPLELVAHTVTRAETGEVFFTANYEIDDS